MEGPARSLRFCLAGLLLALLFAAGPAAGEERIVAFDSEVWVRADASMSVVETITVDSAGQEIKRGIFRDFPTDYRDPSGRRVRVGFEVDEVRRNGQPEPYHTERQDNGVRLYIGQEDVIIPAGRHVYEITYHTDRQLGFFEGRDELYWNVTGNSWAFEILRARVRIHLPESARIFEQTAYTGYQGEQKSDATYSLENDGSITFETTRPLHPGQGLTIAISWPVGFIARPSEADKLAYFLRDHSQLIAGLLGFAVLALYYLIVWVLAGRDPKTDTIVPRYSPPEGFSPAAARYVTRMGYDDKVFAAAIVSLAVKGYLTIQEDEKKTYTLELTDREAVLSPGERAVVRKLFSHGGKKIELKQTNHKKLQSARNALQEWLRTEFETLYFVRNGRYFYPGLALSVIVILVLAVTGKEPFGALFLCLWLSVWTLAIYFLGRRVWRGWQAVLTGGGAGLPAAIVSTLFATPFFAGELFGLFAFADVTSTEAAVLLVAIQGLNVLFYHLLKAPTRLGRRIMDQIAGFADYLSVAEKDRMNLLNPPERTPELFERFLPYALALGVEQAWSEQFADVLAGAGKAEGRTGRHYSPRWYSGSGWHGDFGDLNSSLGGLSGAVTSASSAPGSSSGSSGGGSSGGGGGGGGGGGW